MEKYIKSLSMGLIIMTVMFFLNMFGAANAAVLHIPGFMEKLMIVGANVFLFAIPVLFLVVFGFGMTSIFKRILNNQKQAVRKTTDKFPVLWFILSGVSFTAYYIFVSMIFSSGV